MSLFANLVCALEGHRPESGGQWNGGYCFSRCRRCGRDMIRLGSGQWQVPKGYRVVWKRKDEVQPTRRPTAPRTRRSPPATIIAASPAKQPEVAPHDPMDDWLADLPAAPKAGTPADPGDFMSDEADGAAPAPQPPADKYRVGQ